MSAIASNLPYRQYLESKVKSHQPNGFSDHVIPESLFDFQQSVTKWAINKGRCCLFAGTGLGKTRMQLTWASNMPGKKLVLAPLAVSAQTIREAKSIGLDAGTLGSGCAIEVTNYDRLDHALETKWDAVVLDESSIIKSHDGKTRQKLQAFCERVPYRLMCSATPAPNDYMELGTHSEIVGAMTRQEMLATYFTHDLEHTSEWRLKRHAVKDFWQWVATWAVCFAHPRDIGFSPEGYDLPPITIDHWVVEDPEDPLAGWASVSATDLTSTGRSTIEQRCDIVQDLVQSSGDQWLIWCHTNEEQSAIEKRLPGVLSVRGHDKSEVKESRLIEFCDGKRHLVTKPSIAGFGMNWQQCHNMVFAGVTFSFESMYQAIRRCWRFGQLHPVRVVIIAPESHGKVLSALARKEEDFNAMRKEMRKFSNVNGVLA